MIFLITGLPGSGKTTCAKLLQKALNCNNIALLDGDHIRQCWPSLGYSDSERSINIERISDIAGYLSNKKLHVIMSIVCPDSKDRLSIRSKFGEHHFKEIYLPTVITRRPDSHYPIYKEHRNMAPEITGLPEFYKFIAYIGAQNGLQ